VQAQPRRGGDQLAAVFCCGRLPATGGSLPTAQDDLGSGKWQIMPGFGVRYSFLEWGDNTYFVPATRYAMSFAGNRSKRDISQPQIAPTFNVGLPDKWFVTLYPSYDIRINFGDPNSRMPLTTGYNDIAVKLSKNLDVSVS
jgi:hypothetical protein